MFDLDNFIHSYSHLKVNAIVSIHVPPDAKYIQKKRINRESDAQMFTKLFRIRGVPTCVAVMNSCIFYFVYSTTSTYGVT